MKTWRVRSGAGVLFASCFTVLAAFVYSAQVKSGVTAAANSSDPAIRWQFDTHG